MRHYLWHAFHWGGKPRDPVWVDARIAHWRRFVLPQLQAMRPLFDRVIVYCRSTDAYAIAQWRRQPVDVVLYDMDRLASDAILAADRGQDWIAWTRLDTDDLLGVHFRHLLDQVEPADGLAAVCAAPGLCLDVVNRQWGEWRHEYPANSTIFIPGERWQQREAAWAYAYCKHGEVRRFRPVRLPAHSYCVLIHGANDSSTLRHPIHPTGRLAEQIGHEFPALREYLR